MILMIHCLTNSGLATSPIYSIQIGNPKLTIDEVFDRYPYIYLVGLYAQ